MPEPRPVHCRLQRALSREDRFHRGVDVFAVDLDRLQSINEHHGHDVGDAVLVVVAQCLESVLSAYDAVSRPGPLVSRLGGDGFFALCEDVGDNVAVAAIGTGYSSLSHLKRFPIDEVKIDKSFVDGLGTDPEDTAIVAAIVAMAHALGLLVVAEGVETADQLQRLGNLGCEMAPGYLFSRPVPAEDLAALGSVLRSSGDKGTGPSPTPAADVVLIADGTADVRQLAKVNKVAAFSAGADDHIVKPFAPRELVSRIRQAIARRALP